MSGVIYRPKGRALEYSELALNLFDGCVHGCTYCYVPATVKIGKEIFHAHTPPRSLVIERLRADAPKYAGTDQRVLLCFTCDPYPPRDYGVTRKAIKILREHNIPFQVLTKGGIRAARDFDLYGPNDAFATTLTFAANHRSLEFEPNAPLPSDRIRAIDMAKREGLTTWVSLEPVIDPQQSLACIEKTHDFVDHYKIGVLNHAKSHTDWRAFGIRAIELCEQYGVTYFIKHDLAQHLGGVDYHSTDLRRVKRSCEEKSGRPKPPGAGALQPSRS